MNVAISDNKYKPQIPTTEQWEKYIEYKQKVQAEPISQKEKQKLIDEYLKEHGL